MKYYIENNFRKNIVCNIYCCFLNKLKIVDEEADESLFWLEFIQGLEIDCDKNELERLIKEANELVSIFSAGIKTIKQKNNLK